MSIVAVAVMGALIPTAIYVLFVWWLDRYEKEPLWLLALAFFWGAGPAAFLAVAFEELIFPAVATLGADGQLSSLIQVGIVAPLVEESLKGVALIGLVIVFYDEFDDVLDGIIYGAMIGFGFALTENIFGYFLPSLGGEPVGRELPFIFLRTIVFGANHAFWTGIIGAAVGYARLARNWPSRLLSPLGGWLLAVLFHSLHNIGTSMIREELCFPLGISLLVDWGGLLLLLLVAAMALRRECLWIEKGLFPEVNQGLLTVQEYDILRSAGRRLWVQLQAFQQGGRQASRAVGRYFQTATELAFEKRHMSAAGDREEESAEIRQLRKELADHRESAWPWLRRA
jgi:RsiW-degrading membrane proteinase PrsW (M82 family)